jgi:hypothetical protein
MHGAKIQIFYESAKKTVVKFGVRKKILGTAKGVPRILDDNMG